MLCYFFMLFKLIYMYICCHGVIQYQKRVKITFSQLYWCAFFINCNRLSSKLLAHMCDNHIRVRTNTQNRAMCTLKDKKICQNIQEINLKLYGHKIFDHCLQHINHKKTFNLMPALDWSFERPCFWCDLKMPYKHFRGIVAFRWTYTYRVVCWVVTCRCPAGRQWRAQPAAAELP